MMQRFETPKLYMMCGLPGAGKTYFARYASAKTGGVHLNSVRMRQALLLDSDVVPRTEGDPLVFGAMDEAARAIMEASHSVFYDASHNLAVVRDRSRALASSVGALAILLWVDTPIDVAAERASNRQPDPMTKRLPPEMVHGYTIEPPRSNETSIIINGRQPAAEQFQSFQEQLYE